MDQPNAYTTLQVLQGQGLVEMVPGHSRNAGAWSRSTVVSGGSSLPPTPSRKASGPATARLASSLTATTKLGWQ
jgi:hypothetical protein